MNIDWSKAPDWADAHGLHETGFGIKEFWLGETQHQNLEHAKSFPYGGGDPSCGSFHNSRRASFSYVTSRPERWTGEGLPPVGAHVVVCDDGSLVYGQGESGEVLAHVDGCAVIRMSYGLGCFLPRCLRTPEQITAEEHRAKYMPQLIQLWDADTAREAFLEAVYEMILEVQKQ